MRTYVLAITGLIVFTTLGKLLWLAKGEFPPRSRGIEAWDVVVNVGLIVWGAVVLSNAA